MTPNDLLTMAVDMFMAGQVEQSQAYVQAALKLNISRKDRNSDGNALDSVILRELRAELKECEMESILPSICSTCWEPFYPGMDGLTQCGPCIGVIGYYDDFSLEWLETVSKWVKENLALLEA